MQGAKNLFGWLGRHDWAVALVLGAVAAVVVFQYWGPPVHLTDPDALFYEAQAEEVRGVGRQEALDKVFASDLADPLKESEADMPPARRRVDNPEWVEYSSQFYRRRWTLPVLTAAAEPVFGDNTLEDLSLGFYVVAMMLLYLLLRRRFAPFVSAAVTGGALLLPPLRLAASEGLTDSLGLALLIAGLLCAILALERDARWLWAWAPVVLVLSFTRDLTLVLVLVAAWLAFRMRTRTSYWLLGSGILASLPAPLAAGTPLRENLAYVIDGYHVPGQDSWAFVVGHYPHQLWDTVSQDFSYPLGFTHPLPMLAALAVILAGIAVLLALPARGDRFIQMMRAALLGGAITILLSVNYTEWRLELAMLPPIAVGVALLAELLIARLPSRLGGERLRPLARREAPSAA